MKHKHSILGLLLPQGRGQKTYGQTIRPLALALVALATVAAMSSNLPVARAVSAAPQDEYSFLVDNPEMIVVSHYPAGSDTAFLVANPEMILVPHYDPGSETAFLIANPEMILVPHYDIGSETAMLVANPELIVARIYDAVA